MEPTMYGSTLGLEFDSTRRTPLESVAPFVAEFLGTWLVVFTAGVISILAENAWAWNATALAAIVTVCGYMFGPVSGGHFNPAVSFCAALVGKEAWPKMLVYVVVQVVSALLAGATYSSAFGQSMAVGPSLAYTHTFYPLFVEMFYTAVLCFVLLNVVYSRRTNPYDDQNHFFALAVGFVYVAGGHAAGNISGACFNPAIAFGMDVRSYLHGTTGDAASNNGSWAWTYTAFELLGAGIAALLFRLCRPEERRYDVSPNFEPSLLVKMLSELVGTSVVVLTMGLNLIMKSACTPWSVAAAYMSMIYALSNISGAHFNPAVTLSVMFSGRGKCPPLRALCFFAVQSLAALLMGCVISGVHSKGPYKSDSFCLKPLAVASPSGGIENRWEPVFFVEFLFTFLIAFTVLAQATVEPVASYTRQKFPLGLAIGAGVAAGGFAAGSISGGLLNPASSLGVAISCALAPGADQASPASYFWFFAFFQASGGFAAALLFAITHRNEYKKRDSMA